MGAYPIANEGRVSRIMALKKEQTEVKYSEMIGVNRGGGFASLADASITQANALNNLTHNLQIKV